MERGIGRVFARSRVSATLLVVTTLVAWLAVGNTTIQARAATDCSAPYDTGPYLNPLRDASLTAKRIDQGVDYYATGPIYAMGDGVIDKVTDTGWPYGVFIAYHLCDGPAQNYEVYAAECIQYDESLFFGEHVSAYTQLGTAITCNDPNPAFGCRVQDQPSCGIEIGWANRNRLGQTTAGAYGQGSQEGNATYFGINFNEFLKSLGALSGNSPVNPQCGSLSGPSCLPMGWPNAHNGDVSGISGHEGPYGGGLCPYKPIAQNWLITSKSYPFSVYFQGRYLGDEEYTVYMWRLVSSVDASWCFEATAFLSWVDGHQPRPTGSFDINIRIGCNGAIEGTGWAFDQSYTNYQAWVNTGWSRDDGPCNSIINNQPYWGVDNADGSYGSQIQDQWGNKFNYGIPSGHTTYLTYGTF
jgi:hypothetical protein